MGRVESGNDGGKTKSELGVTFFGGNWGITGEDIGGLGFGKADSGGISSSWYPQQAPSGQTSPKSSSVQAWAVVIRAATKFIFVMNSFMLTKLPKEL